jgi:hypothetical protein
MAVAASADGKRNGMRQIGSAQPERSAGQALRHLAVERIIELTLRAEPAVVDVDPAPTIVGDADEQVGDDLVDEVAPRRIVLGQDAADRFPGESTCARQEDEAALEGRGLEPRAQDDTDIGKSIERTVGERNCSTHPLPHILLNLLGYLFSTKKLTESSRNSKAAVIL